MGIYSSVVNIATLALRKRLFFAHACHYIQPVLVKKPILQFLCLYWLIISGILNNTTDTTYKLSVMVQWKIFLKENFSEWLAATARLRYIPSGMSPLLMEKCNFERKHLTYKIFSGSSEGAWHLFYFRFVSNSFSYRKAVEASQGDKQLKPSSHHCKTSRKEKDF